MLPTVTNARKDKMENKFSLDDFKRAYFHAVDTEMDDFNKFADWDDEDRAMHTIQSLYALDIVLRMREFLEKKGNEDGRTTHNA